MKMDVVAFPPATAAGATGVDAALAHALADELVALTTTLSDLAYDLGSEPETLRRHMVSIQSIDRITQVQLGIAEILRSADPTGDRLSTVTLESLHASLRDNWLRHLARLDGKPGSAAG